MSELKGPWECDRCGKIWFPKPLGAIACTYECNGDLQPHDLRAPNPLLPLVKELREAIDNYGEHRRGCAKVYRSDSGTCSCGLESMLDRAKKATEEEK